MSTPAVVDQLLAVQALDKILGEKLQMLDRLPADFQKLAAEESKVNAALKEKEDLLKSHEVRRQQLDVELKAEEAKIVKYKNQQLEVKKNEEYEALEHEMQRARDRISEIEDEEIALLMDLDDEREALEIHRVETQKQLEALAQERHRLEAIQKDYESELDGLRSQRETAFASLAPNPADLYESVRSAGKKMPFVAQLSDGRCQGCHLKISADTLAELKSADGLGYCEHCGRLLYC